MLREHQACLVLREHLVLLVTVEMLANRAQMEQGDQRDLLAPRGLLVSQETKGMLEHQDKLGPRDPLDLLEK